MRLALSSYAMLLTLLGNAQSPDRDSANFVILTDGQKLYSHNIRLKTNSTAKQYLELCITSKVVRPVRTRSLCFGAGGAWRGL